MRTTAVGVGTLGEIGLSMCAESTVGQIYR
jgi:hypothetical protein